VPGIGSKRNQAGLLPLLNNIDQVGETARLGAVAMTSPHEHARSKFNQRVATWLGLTRLRIAYRCCPKFQVIQLNSKVATTRAAIFTKNCCNDRSGRLRKCRADEHAGPRHCFEKRWHARYCANRLYAALRRLEQFSRYKNCPLILGHNRTYQCHLGVSSFEVRRFGRSQVGTL
jgi:hypothetical protein